MHCSHILESKRDSLRTPKEMTPLLQVIRYNIESVCVWLEGEAVSLIAEFYSFWAPFPSI